ncbi:MAG: ATP-binding cassette domain-containing protein [Lachnospiraceae bacterium]|nr:ATP-binding cassette domain-containing protein [Lachnospiraceae bacterium]
MSLSVHIRKKMGNFQLCADLEHSGGITGILGASGCGKSMTLKCIAGIEKPDEGQILLNGRILFDSEKKINLRPQERRVGYLFQNYALFPNMTVEQNVLCGLCREKDRQQRRRKMLEAVEVMELTEQRKLYPHQLSGGQQQRAALARMLVSEPELLLLDEPFSALDAYLREQMQTQVRRILEQFGKDVLLVSHSRDEVYYLCGHLAVMDHGNILTMGDTKDIFADPGSRTAAILTGCKNLASARKTGEYEVEVPEWGIRLKTGKQVGDSVCGVGIRAHYFNPKTRENQFPVVYSVSRDEPFESRILFRYAGQSEASPDLWWRIPKERKPQQMPEKLGIAPGNVFLLYPERQYFAPCMIHAHS